MKKTTQHSQSYGKKGTPPSNFFGHILHESIEFIWNTCLDPLGFPRIKTTAARPTMLLRAKGLKRSLPIGLNPLPSFRQMQGRLPGRETRLRPVGSEPGRHRAGVAPNLGFHVGARSVFNIDAAIPREYSRSSHK